MGGVVSDAVSTVTNAVTNPVQTVTNVVAPGIKDVIKNPVNYLAPGVQQLGKNPLSIYAPGFKDLTNAIPGAGTAIKNLSGPAQGLISQVGRGISGQPAPGGGGGGSGDYGPGKLPAGGMNGYDELGRPLAPNFNSALQWDGTLGDQYKINIGNQPQLNTRALDEIRSRALSPGMSAWGQIQLGRQLGEQGIQQDQMASRQNTANAKAFNDLAMRGGVSNAARERIASNNARGGMMDVQNLYRQGALDRLGIASQDEQQKTDMLKSLPGQELAALNPQFQYMDMQNKANQYNSSSALDAINKQNQYNLGMYNSAMSAWGANKAADAQIAALNNQGAQGGLLAGLGLGGFTF